MEGGEALTTRSRATQAEAAGLHKPAPRDASRGVAVQALQAKQRIGTPTYLLKTLLLNLAQHPCANVLCRCRVHLDALP